MRTGIANLPLHYGRAPRWLFERMTRLAREIAAVLVSEYGPEALLRRLSDPFWFQSFGCVLGFDWHSSGVTTTVCGALKAGLAGLENELGVFLAGGKGAASRRTPREIEVYGDRFGVNADRLIYTSRLVAKVDNNALQDGFQIYHHQFIFTAAGEWAVVQQGMDVESRMARRYHWLGPEVRDLVEEPHAAICCDRRGEVLNLTARESRAARQVVAEIASQKPEVVLRDLRTLQAELTLPQRHQILLSDIHPDRLEKIFVRTYERQPADFEGLLALEGVGPKTIRALSLVSELIYGVEPSFRDPARYAFAHGGKDGHPFPVDRATYDESIELLGKAIRKAKLGRREELEALKRLSTFGG